MNFHIVIPAHNEEAYLSQTLQSLVAQTLLPKKIIVVNDASTDGTQVIIDRFSKEFNFIEGVYQDSLKQQISPEGTHAPGSKVIQAFNKGFQTLDSDFDVICKFDADLLFPSNYLEKVAAIFRTNPEIGMAGGFCYIEKSGKWELENLTNKDHLRGALKAYRKECFTSIGGLKNSMGWDTVDELLAQYHGWQIITDSSLHVKHLKPTGKAYGISSKYKQGEAFYKMRYGFLLTLIASAKLAFRKRSVKFFLDCIKGYYKAKNRNVEFVVSQKEGVFIRDLRWKNIFRKLGIR